MTRSGKKALSRRMPARRVKPNALLRLMEPRSGLNRTAIAVCALCRKGQEKEPQTPPTDHFLANPYQGVDIPCVSLAEKVKNSSEL
jgi:hypothetical protein